MNITLYMATSADGFIAGPHDETPWSDDAWVAFKDFVKTCDVVLLGRRTYEIMTAQNEFIEGPEYIVATRNSLLNTGSLRKVTIQSAADMPEADKIGVIGGGDLNGSLAKLGLIDEIVLDIEPIALGNGKRLFGDTGIELALGLIDSRKIGNSTIQNRYKVRGSHV